MNVYLLRWDGTFLIGCASDELDKLSDYLFDPAQVIYMPVQSNIHGSAGIGFTTSIVFIGIEEMNAPTSYQTRLLDTDPLKKQYIEVLKRYKQSLIDRQTTN